MKMNLTQTKIVGLTMELELRAIEYKRLCDKLDKLKKKNIDENDERLFVLKDLFELNNKQIVELNKQLKELKNSENIERVNKEEKYNQDEMFKKNKKEIETINTTPANITVAYSKDNIFKMIWTKIKRVLNIGK